MTEKRIIVEDSAAAREAGEDALARMISGVDERVEQLEKTREITTPCRIDHQALAAGMQGLVDGLDAKIEAAVMRALDEHSRRLADDSDYHLPPMARHAANVVTSHWWDRFSKRFTMAVLMAGLAVLLAVGTYVAARLGVIK